MSAGKGKRGADGPLAATSSSSGSSDEDSPRHPPVSFQETVLEPQLELDSASAAASPLAAGAGKLLTKGGFMSTPRIGQMQHQDVRKPKLKKKRADLTVGDLGMTKATLQPATPRSRPARDPLPMRMRALPQSFWQQPNRPHNVSPATFYPVLPPLITREGEDVSDLRPVTPPDAYSDDERETTKDKTSRGAATPATAAAAAAATMPLSKTMPMRSDRHHGRQPERSITVTNTELLTKLFEVIEKDGKKANQNPPIKKSRQRKSTLLAATAATGTNFLSGRDPYMIDSIAEKLFPQLSLENSRSYASYCGNTRLQLLTLKDGDKIVTLPSLTIDQQNYPQMLSELVTHI